MSSGSKIQAEKKEGVLRIVICLLGNGLQEKKTNHAVSNALSFVVVRNPWDRLRSAYVDKISRGKQMPKHMQADKMNRIVTFTEFVAYVEEYPDENIHWQPVSSRCLTIPSVDGKTMFRYDHIIKIEEGLSEQLFNVFGMAGISSSIFTGNYSILHQNVKSNVTGIPNELITFYLNAANDTNSSVSNLIERVRRIYQDDIEQFGYSFPS